MAILEGLMGYGENAKECKPDYEGIIKSKKKELSKTTTLLGAIWDYVEDMPLSDSLAMMVGELEWRSRNLTRQIDHFIKRQEKE